MTPVAAFLEGCARLWLIPVTWTHLLAMDVSQSNRVCSMLLKMQNKTFSRFRLFIALLDVGLRMVMLASAVCSFVLECRYCYTQLCCGDNIIAGWIMSRGNFLNVSLHLLIAAELPEGG